MSTIEKLIKAGDKYRRDVKAGLIQPTPPEANPVARYFNSKMNSRAAAIHAMCADCVGCSMTHREPGYLRAVYECAIKTCPLWNFRRQPKTSSEA